MLCAHYAGKEREFYAKVIFKDQFFYHVLV